MAAVGGLFYFRRGGNGMATLVSVREAAEQFGVSVSKLYEMVKQKRIPCHRFGDLVRLDPAEVLRATRSEAENGD